MTRGPSNRTAASAYQIEDYSDERYDQQQVNQAPGNVQAKAQQPEDQKNSNDCPKHVNLLYSSVTSKLAINLDAAEEISATREKFLVSEPR